MQPTRFWALLIFSLSLTANPAAAQLFAKTEFAAYEGPDAVQEGSGGTKVTKNGVDFWMTGAPPRKYRVLGIVSDSRGSGLLSGNALTSPSVAAKVKEVGGDAVVVIGQDSQVRGAFISNGAVSIARTKTTQLLVVRYEDAGPSSAPN